MHGGNGQIILFIERTVKFMAHVVMRKTESDFNDYIDSEYSSINICGVEYNLSDIFKKIDEIRYNIEFDTYCNKHIEYECEHCGGIYDDENEANFCCADLINNNENFECKYCGRMYLTEESASDCCKGF